MDDALGDLRDRHAAGREILHERGMNAGLALEAVDALGAAPGEPALDVLLRKSRPPRSCGGFERHTVALALEEVDRAPRDALAVLLIVVIGTKLSIDRVIRED